MGLMDKVKAGAEQAKEMASAAATKAKEEAKELQLKRELNDAFQELGKATFERLESGEITAPSLADQATKIRELNKQLADLAGS
jgi:hypothetical protein